ncbi:MAG: nucleotidyl transferase AbiEii/AbiGii toxin family protein [Thermodesulfobacteriota bacterium]|nr:nucleotidyl transferase AbiEii/AbiGii toxin family protein [Thermodesulfobacteriota bacterium]
MRSRKSKERFWNRTQEQESTVDPKSSFSRFSTKQVLLKAHTLQQTMEKKIQAFLDRGEIRDAFDIEFLLRRGVEIPFRDKGQFVAFQKKLARLRDRDFKVKLGSILEDDIRKYCLTHRFGFLQERLASMVF